MRGWLDRGWVRTVLGLAVLAAVLGGLFAFDRFSNSEEVGPLDGRSPDVGEFAPQFALRDSNGSMVALGDLEGQVVWVNFWATWCGPCLRELPEIQRLASEFEDRGLVVLAVNQEQSVGEAEGFWEDLGLDLPILLDSNGDVSRQYSLRGLPANFFMDRDGTLRASDLGFLTEEQMRERLATVGLE